VTFDLFFFIHKKLIVQSDDFHFYSLRLNWILPLLDFEWSLDGKFNFVVTSNHRVDVYIEEAF